MMVRLRLATRQSALALIQANAVKAALEAAHPQLEIELVHTLTTGDQIQDRSLAAIGGKGLFVKRLEELLLTGKADCAVHSLKDVPPILDGEFCLAATLERASPFDALVSRNALPFKALPKGARVGTCSVRRRAALLHLRPDLNIIEVRGNVDTRLAKLARGEFDALILAEAGLRRLGLEQMITETFPANVLLPSVGQGVIAIECLHNAPVIQAYLHAINHPETFTCSTAERHMNAELGASCTSPVGSYAYLQGDILHLEGTVWSPTGDQKTSTHEVGSQDEALILSARAAAKLRPALLP